jgi:hypothetical protein
LRAGRAGLLAFLLALTALGAAAPSTARPTVFPLRVVPGTRTLVQADGKPFLLVGDAAWSLIAQPRNAQVDRYLDDRKRRGFNTILVNLIEHKYASRAPRDAYGQAPFLVPGNFATPNPKYFTHVDAVIAKARARGMLVLLAPMYLGFEGGDQGWWAQVQRNGAARLRRFGRYLGARYRRFDNVLWVEGGDFDPPPAGRRLVTALADGIRSADGALQTFHGSRGTSAFAFWQRRPPWLNVNTIYTNDSSVVAHARREYIRSTRPFFLIEAVYENEGADAAGVRRQAYQAILSGASGEVMGNNPTWLFSGGGWQAALDSAGARSMTVLAGLFRSLPWWQLRPDSTHVLVTGGVEPGAGAVAAARAANGSFAVVYVPTTRTITVDLTRLSGSRVQAQWFDPVSGRFMPVNGSPFPRGVQTFTAPATNAGRDPDSVLVLRSVG